MKQLNKCVCCNSDNLITIMDLGDQPPANNYNVTEKFPLKLNICCECSHAQLSHAVDPDILFKDYPYMSGASQTMLDYYKRFAEKVNEKFSGSTVMDIACNDGSQLDAFAKMGYTTFGVEPSQMYAVAKKKGHCIYNSYMNKHIGFYDILVAQNVLAHVSDPLEFLKDCYYCMDEGSVLIIQTSQANMIKNHQFDTIYHEHISFFNKRSFSKLFNRANLQIVDYWFEGEIHGGSDVYVLKKIPKISNYEYLEFSKRCKTFADEFRVKVEGLQKEGNKVICYGAAAKMINLIRFTGIKPDYIIDDTPTKIGKTICGLVVTNELPSEGYIVPVWNFYREIKEKCQKKGDYKYIQYIPEIIIE